MARKASTSLIHPSANLPASQVHELDPLAVIREVNTQLYRISDQLQAIQKGESRMLMPYLGFCTTLGTGEIRRCCPHLTWKVSYFKDQPKNIVTKTPEGGKSSIPNPRAGEPGRSSSARIEHPYKSAEFKQRMVDNPAFAKLVEAANQLAARKKHLLEFMVRSDAARLALSRAAMDAEDHTKAMSGQIDTALEWIEANPPAPKSPSRRGEVNRGQPDTQETYPEQRGVSK